MTLTVVRALGLITIQDLGRPGHMHEALPPGGALIPSALIAANRVAGNPNNAPALEILGTLVVRADSDTVIVVDAPRTLRAGTELSLSSEPHRAAYLALAGGIASPLLLGGRGAHLSAGIGKLLRPGDRLSPLSPLSPGAPLSPRSPLSPLSPGSPLSPRSPLTSISAAPPSSPTAPVLPPSHVGPPASPPLLRVIAGPDLDAFDASALATLTSAPYRILPTSDRVGTRLSGPPLPRRPDHLERSRPMVRGALEVPRDGAPIVLGPEHPTTGGYPILAVIRHADLDTFFSIRLGGSVRFALA